MAFRSACVDRNILAPRARDRVAGSAARDPGTGKGDLSGIVGSGRWKAGPGARATFELTYEVG
jgi:hypothetical protein